MDTTYVPNYLLYVTRGTAGWPKTVADDKEFQEWLTQKCREVLEQRVDGLTLREIYDGIRYIISCNRNRDSYENDARQAAKLGALWDHIFACIDRALRETAREVWRLNEENIDYSASAGVIRIDYEWRCSGFRSIMPAAISAELHDQTNGFAAKLLEDGIRSEMEVKTTADVPIPERKMPQNGWNCTGKLRIKRERRR